ncbi:MAG: carboxypeptidase-like regulatory domain-containing protein [Bacteroidetes bacterium]|nr:carboxypeptidase-like regulatory domain-containing protein [Bacteroidota bacterium]
MKIRIMLSFLLCLLLSNLYLAAQNEDVQIIIRGIVKDKNTQEPVSFAHIYIPEKNVGTVSDVEGEFKFKLSSIDSIVISAVGYEYQVIYFNDSVFNNELKLNISLIPKVYELAEVRINPYPNYIEFKRSILDYEMTSEEISIHALNNSLHRKRASSSRRPDPLYQYKFSVGLLISSPVSAVSNIFSRWAKHQIKYQMLLMSDKLELEVKSKFNPEIVKSLTGMIDDDKITDFMNFCSFHDELILESSLFDLCDRIKECYKEYMIDE